MATETQLKQWRKHYRQSVQALPVAAGCTVVLCVVLWALSFRFTIPLWLVIILVGIAIFSVVGDVVNILYLRAMLRTAAGGEE